MESVEGAKNCLEAFGDWKQKLRPDLDRPITIMGSKVTAIELTRHVTRSLADLHGKYWLNKEFLEKNKDWLMHADWFRGENLDFYKKVNAEMGQLLFIGKYRLTGTFCNIK